MLTNVAVNIIFLAAAVAVLIPKRTRSLVLAVAFVWFVVQAVSAYNGDDSSVSTVAAVAALSTVANWVINRKKYLKELKG